MNATVQLVLDMQAKLRACPKVAIVWITLDGERSVDAIYDTLEAAQAHRDWYNRVHSTFYGRASVSSEYLRNAEIAKAFSEDA